MSLISQASVVLSLTGQRVDITSDRHEGVGVDLIIDANTVAQAALNLNGLTFQEDSFVNLRYLLEIRAVVPIETWGDTQALLHSHLRNRQLLQIYVPRLELVDEVGARPKTNNSFLTSILPRSYQRGATFYQMTWIATRDWYNFIGVTDGCDSVVELVLIFGEVDTFPTVAANC